MRPSSTASAAEIGGRPCSASCGTNAGVAMFLVVVRRSGPQWDALLPLEEQSGWDAHASFMDGLIRIDLAKGIYPEKSVRANLYVEARF